MIARSAALLCLLAACPGTPRSAAGRTKEVPVAVAMDRTPLEIDVDSPPGPPPHWYRVTLAMPSYLRAAVPEFDASAFETQVLRPDGTESFGNDALTGPVLVRVTGDSQPYRLHLTATTPPTARVTYEPCDPNHIDPANPRCAGVEPCDYNNPDFKNPSCCSRVCLRGPCSFEIVAGDDGPNGIYAWIGAGASTGVVRGMHGTAEVRMRDGTVKTISTSVKQVERERSKIYVGPDSDQPNLAHWIVRLEPPMECQAKAMRRR